MQQLTKISLIQIRDLNDHPEKDWLFPPICPALACHYTDESIPSTLIQAPTKANWPLMRWFGGRSRLKPIAFDR